MIERAILNKRWLTPIFWAYLFTHAVMIIGFPFLNRGRFMVHSLGSIKGEHS